MDWYHRLALRRVNPGGRRSDGCSLRYDRRPLNRFLLLCIPLLVMIMALFGLVQELAGVEAPFESGWHPKALGARVAIASWILESTALTALFLLARGRAPTWWLDGFLAGWLAWLFRGPVVILAIASMSEAHSVSWGHLVLNWWLLYSICGLTLALLARTLSGNRG